MYVMVRDGQSHVYRNAFDPVKPIALRPPQQPRSYLVLEGAHISLSALPCARSRTPIRSEDIYVGFALGKPEMEDIGVKTQK